MATFNSYVSHYQRLLYSCNFVAESIAVQHTVLMMLTHLPIIPAHWPQFAAWKVVLLSGEGVDLNVPTSALGREVRDMIYDALMKPGVSVSLTHSESGALHLNKTLLQQGLVGNITLSCTYTPTSVYAAWQWFQGQIVPEDENACDGVTELKGINHWIPLHLPRSLKSLTFGDRFDTSLDSLNLPTNLQSLTFGRSFNRNLERVNWPSSLQHLTFGSQFNQSLAGVTFPSCLPTLTFGSQFNQRLAGGTLPISLQTLTFGSQFDQSLKDVTLPSSLQTLTFGSRFQQDLADVTLPSCLQTLNFGISFKLSLKGVVFPSSLLRICWLGMSVDIEE